MAWSKKLYLKDGYLIIENYLFRPRRFFLKDIENVDYDWEEMQYYINKYVDNFEHDSNETIPEPYAKPLRLPLNVVFWIFGIDYDKHVKEAGNSIKLFEIHRDLIRNDKQWMKLIPKEEVVSIIKTMQVNIMPMLIIKPRDGKRIRIMYSLESEYFKFVEQVRKEIKESKSTIDTRVNE
jgi:ADP-dependent phosphofructokinase/glucokinase